MSKKSGKAQLRKLKLNVQNDVHDDLDEDFEGDFDIDMDSEDLPYRMYNDDWDKDDQVPDRFSARRKIERRRDMKKVFSDLDEWEQFGDDNAW